MNRRIASVIVVCLVVVGLSSASALAAAAAEGDPVVTFSPENPAAGEVVTMSGSGCLPGEAVALRIWATRGGTSTERGITADPAGGFVDEPIEVPADWGQGTEFGIGFWCGGVPTADPLRSGIDYGVTYIEIVPPVEPPVGDGNLGVEFFPESPDAGGTLSVSGAGCAPEASILLRVWGTSAGGLVEQRFVAGADGAFNDVDIPLPEHLVGGDQFGVAFDCSGFWLETPGAFGKAFGVVATVPPPPVPPVPPAPPAPPVVPDAGVPHAGTGGVRALAETGAGEDGRLMGLAIGLILAGAVAVRSGIRQNASAT